MSIAPTDVITVVGGGWSAAEIVKQPLPGFVIGANEAGVRVKCDVAVSMDRLFVENRWPQISARAIPFHARKSALYNIVERPNWLHPFDCDHKSGMFSEDAATLNGPNSGHCALNYAWLLRPRTLYLVGFDMNRNPKTGEAYWHKAYAWSKPKGGTGSGRYAEWVEAMNYAAGAFRKIGTEVYNVSLTSSITNFPKISAEQFRKIQEA